MATRVWKWVQTVVIGRIKKLLLNKFGEEYQPSDTGGTLTACNAAKYKMASKGAPKRLMGSGTVSSPRVLGAPVKFRQISFLKNWNSNTLTSLLVKRMTAMPFVRAKISIKVSECMTT